ncbi:hypothetical protein Cni_G25292 [Canna indica]|uniref:Uncharacterized protein n=1 Tax=Canna indica TaxID=4628 RepID=A0AAQ3KXP1_9LILI|nr:hypothetical protein Cni_G25292 [Canna indica]
MRRDFMNLLISIQQALTSPAFVTTLVLQLQDGCRLHPLLQRLHPRASAQVQPRPSDVAELLHLMEELQEKESRIST